ncbi:MAG: formylglycine-generating enzyme family protein, partial [Gammaproteobacteria bacterium]
RADVVEADDGSGPVFSGNTLGRIRDWMHRYFPRGARQAQGRNIPYPDIAWVEIPGGPFLYQGETRELPTFWLARYPVTNAQYQCFIDDGGYDEDRWWADLEKPEPTTPSWSAKNRPRTDVDWYEAMAFCRWFNARLGLAADTVRLPTEIEWERAAAGREGADYPWGKGFRSGFANLDENENKDGPWHLEQATAVGVYPHGASAEGALDLAGQVWEWCLNKHEDIDATRADGSSDSRALRGGSWFYYPDFARASFRYWDYPDYRNYHWGFRLLSSSPPVL